MGALLQSTNPGHVARGDSPKPDTPCAVRRGRTLTIVGAHIRIPSWQVPLYLGYAAERFLPGGVETLMHLAWLSQDEKAREVARRWNALSKPHRQTLAVEVLCMAVGVRSWDLVAVVARTGWELGIDTSGLIEGASLAEGFAGFMANAAKPQNYRMREAVTRLAGQVRPGQYAPAGPEWPSL